MLVKFKRTHPDARLPTCARAGDVGYDLYSCETLTILPGRVAKVKTGLCIADWHAQLRVCRASFGDENGTRMVDLTVYPKMEGRSSLGARGIFTIAGIIDPTYRGELCVTLANMTGDPYGVNTGDRIAQFVFYTVMTAPDLGFAEAEEIVPTDRGSQGFGSTGR